MKNTKIRIGIFFGGPSREREVSFAGGRTVYDNLDKSLFIPIPIFVDSLGNLVILDWPYIYKGTIRDFYPVEGSSSSSKYSHYVESYFDGSEEAYKNGLKALGNPIQWEDLREYIDFAFLALHGRFGEDGIIQALMSQNGIPYSGSGILPSAIGIDKSVQKKWMTSAGFVMPKILRIPKNQWLHRPEDHIDQIKDSFRGRLVIRPAHQGSSIGVSILENPNSSEIQLAMDSAFFIQKWTGRLWQEKSEEEKELWSTKLPDIKESLGLPLYANNKKLHQVEEVLSLLNKLTKDEKLTLRAGDGEELVIIEEFIQGREFSCIVVRSIEGKSIALPPTEIIKKGNLYDYKSKYLPGFSRKETPINLPQEEIQKIMTECERLFEYLEFNCYARIDGFYTLDGEVILNDPNTTSGMLPSSFFFHQAAEIGLNPSQFLTFIVHSSMVERKNEFHSFPEIDNLLDQLDKNIKAFHEQVERKINIAIIFGGYSYERHISVESGRNIYEKLSSSSKYNPIPLFLRKTDTDFELVEVPISLMLKDNADDINEKIQNFHIHPIIQKIQKDANQITSTYSSDSLFTPKVIKFDELKEKFDSVFIALHGRPGEDGALQKKLDKLGLPYNGSSSKVSSITINKFYTLQYLSSLGFIVAEQMIIKSVDYREDNERWINSIVGKFDFPLIAKPVDDGCSSAVKKINNRSQLKVYMDTLLRTEEPIPDSYRKDLNLDWNEEFPKKNEVLIEELIVNNGAQLFIEITCGLMSVTKENQSEILIFEPSEAIASEDILSLEEKFLAGQGLNITPARLSTKNWDYQYVVKKVKSELKRASEAIGVTGYARIDAFVRVFEDGRVETVIIEINSLPGMTPATCIYHQAAIEGMKPYEFIDKIMTFAQERTKKQETWV